MPDRAEHHVLLVQQAGDARFEHVVRRDQAADVFRPFGGQRLARVLRAGEALDPAGEPREGPRDPPQHQIGAAQQHQEQKYGLPRDEQERPRLHRRTDRARDDPALLARLAHRGHQQIAVRFGHARAEARPDLRDLGKQRVALYRAQRDLQFIRHDALPREDLPQTAFGGGIALFSGEQGRGIGKGARHRRRQMTTRSAALPTETEGGVALAAAQGAANGADRAFFTAGGAQQVESRGIGAGRIAPFLDRPVEQQARGRLADQQRHRDRKKALAQKAFREQARHGTRQPEVVRVTSAEKR